MGRVIALEHGAGRGAGAVKICEAAASGPRPPLRPPRAPRQRSSTVAPASSSSCLSASASSRSTPSLTGLGASSTRALASLRPRPVAARTTLMTWIFLSPAAVEDDVERGLLLLGLLGAAAAAAAAGAAAATARRRDAELLLERLDALGELEHRDALELLDPILCAGCHRLVLLVFGRVAAGADPTQLSPRPRQVAPPQVRLDGLRASARRHPSRLPAPAAPRRARILRRPQRQHRRQRRPPAQRVLASSARRLGRGRASTSSARRRLAGRSLQPPRPRPQAALGRGRARDSAPRWRPASSTSPAAAVRLIAGRWRAGLLLLLHPAERQRRGRRSAHSGSGRARRAGTRPARRAVRRGHRARAGARSRRLGRRRARRRPSGRP